MREVMVAPFGSTAFKEGFVGDVFTSAVRPLSDLTFAALYFLSGAHGWAIAHSSELATDNVSNAWMFRKVAVPAITLLPLWWRFCQCLQRSFDTRERWPHLGNAMKYATAIFVSCYGLAHADAKLHPVWLGAFVFATLYQFTWDVFMDWDLIRVRPASTGGLSHDGSQDRRKDVISCGCGSFLLFVPVWEYCRKSLMPHILPACRLFISSYSLEAFLAEIGSICSFHTHSFFHFLPWFLMHTPFSASFGQLLGTLI